MLDEHLGEPKPIYFRPNPLAAELSCGEPIQNHFVKRRDGAERAADQVQFVLDDQSRRQEGRSAVQLRPIPLGSAAP